MRENRFLLYLAGVAILYVWVQARLPKMIAYQTPPHPVMHGNYYSFHDMSEEWDHGNRPGVLNISKNGEYDALNNPYADYSQFQSRQKPQSFCDYYELDIGFLFPVDAARHIFGALPDNYLRTNAFQLFVDLLAVGALFAVFFRWGWFPAMAAALFYARNGPIATQVSLAFYYFWDAILALAVVLLVTLLHARARARGFDAISAFLALSLGVALGFGIWLRSTWVAQSVVLIALIALNRKLWKYLPVASLALIVCGAYPILRASKQAGHFVLTTRQSWSAAFEALGKDPNPYGLENDDQYLFDVAREKYGAVDANCQGTRRDAALKLEYLAIWRRDPGFIIHSIANRLNLGFLSNGAIGNDKEDRNDLILALIGCGWLILRGGSRRWLALSAAALFVVNVASVSLVYFETAHYNGVSQACLIVLGAGALDLLGYFVPRSLRIRQWTRRFEAARRLIRLRKWPVLAACTAIILSTIVLHLPRVKTYFAAPQYQVEWAPPRDLSPEDTVKQIARIHQLPDAARKKLLEFLQLNASAGDPAILTALNTRLRHVVGQNIRDNITRFDLDLDPMIASVAQQALWHSEHFVLGFTVDQIRGFDLAEPSTWSGRLLEFRLKQDDPAVLNNAVSLFLEKFRHRGLKLVSRTGNTFMFTNAAGPLGSTAQ